MSFLKRISDGIFSFVSPRKSDAAAPQVQTPQTVPQFRKLQQKPAKRAREDTFDRAIRSSRSMSPIERVDSWQMGEEVHGLGFGSKRKLLPTPGEDKGYAISGKRARYDAYDQDGDTSMEYEEIYDMEEEEQELEEGDPSDEELEHADSDAESEEADSDENLDDAEVEDEYDDDEGNLTEVEGEVEGEQEGEAGSEREYDEDEEVEEYEEDDESEDEHSYDADALTNDFSALKHSSSPIKIKDEPQNDDSELEVDQDISNIIPEDAYEEEKPRYVDITQEHLYRGIDAAKLRAEGWCDDHIILVQKLAMRGFEPLMPSVFRDLMSYLPHALFARSEEEHQNAYIKSGKGEKLDYALSKYLDRFMNVGGYVRSRASEDPSELPTGKVLSLSTRKYSPHVRKTPEWTIINGVLEFLKYAEERDQPGLETRKKQPTCRIPLLEQVAAPAGTPPEEMQELARFKMEALYRRYEDKFRVRQSIEQSPSNPSANSPTSALTGERLSYPIPQIYCLIASGTVVVLAAYRPDDYEMPVQTTAFFDFKEYGYDAWNVLALAIVVCHCRKVLVRIAEETGVGAFVPGTEDPVYDPDL